MTIRKRVWGAGLASPLLALALGFYTNPAAGIALKKCYKEAVNDIEQLYCDIIASNQGQGLPTLTEFRRNSAATQLLILRNPARRAELTLPSPPSAVDNTRAQTPPAAKKSLTENIGITRRLPSLPARSAVAPTGGKKDLTVCQVIRERIECADAAYYLAVNVPLNRLQPRALGEQNTLQFKGRLSDHSTVQYLSSLYPYYIEKMLAIGLGDSTVSFTKFYALYEESLRQGEDFALRFGKMYELLKNERKQLAVKTRYLDNYPQNIDQCMALNFDLITCDNVHQNWVYQRSKN